MANFKNLLGMKFFRLTVISLEPNKRSKSGRSFKRWKCLCECGKETIVNSVDLLKKEHSVKSCGCLQKETSSINGKNNFISDYYSGTNSIYSSYKRRAARKNIIFNLDWHDFANLIHSDCYYCGKPPSNKVKSYGLQKLDHSYNGIDRIDGPSGYTKENCVPCCWNCNLIKLDISQSDFFKMIKNVYEKHNLKDLK
jgi:hypothetical protein